MKTQNKTETKTDNIKDFLEIARKEVEKEVIAKIGQTKYDEFKKIYGRKLPVIKVEDKIAIFRPIGAEEIGTFSMMMVSEGINEASRYLMQELWLDGDTEILDDEEFFMSAMLQIQKVAEVKKSSFYLM